MLCILPSVAMVMIMAPTCQVITVLRVLCVGGCLHLSPENTGSSPGAGLMLGRRRRRWSNIRPAPGQRSVYA